MHTPIPPKKKKDGRHKLKLFGQTFYVTEYKNKLAWGSRLFNNEGNCICIVPPIYSKEDALREAIYEVYVAIDIVFDDEK